MPLPPLSSALLSPLTWELIPCPPWVISRSLPPLRGTRELIQCPPLGPVKRDIGARPMSPGVDPMALPFIGDVGAHPMYPKKGRETGDVPVSLPLVATYC